MVRVFRLRPVQRWPEDWMGDWASYVLAGPNRRGFCPACGARRMAETAAHLVEHVIPHVPVRQWVISFPIPLRHLFATQRFGSAANLNIHLHCLMLDGVYRLTDGGPVFQAVPAPITDQLQALLTRIITRLLKALTRHGALMAEDTAIPYLTNPDADPALAPLHAAACTYRIALGPRVGQKVLTWKDPSLRLANPEVPQSEGCVSAQGFSLHADTSCTSHQRQKLEQLCRDITRPALGHKRLRRTPASEVVLQLKTPYRDGTTHLVMSPLEFLQPLAALVPRPRLHLIRFHGVLAPNAALRSQIVPGEADPVPTTANGDGDTLAPSTRARLSWAQLLKRVFAIDITTCPQCGGTDPLPRMNSRMSDGAVRGLTPHRVLWYFPVQAKRPFVFPIPGQVACFTIYRCGMGPARKLYYKASNLTPILTPISFHEKNGNQRLRL